MKYDKTTIAGVALCIALILMWNPLMRRMGWLPTRTRRTQTSQERPRQTPEPDTQAVGAPDETAAGERSAPGPDRAPSVQSVPSVQFAPPRQTVTLTVPDYLSADVDTEGGGITSIRLEKYADDDRTGKVCLGQYAYPFCTLISGDPERELNAAAVVTQDREHLAIERRVAGTGMTVLEEWRFAADTPYRMSYRVAVRNDGPEAAALRNLAVACAGMPAPMPARGMASRAATGGGIDMLFEEQTRPNSFSAKHLAKLDSDDRAELAARGVMWIALHSKYFLFYIAPDAAPAPGCDVGVAPGAGEEATPWSYGRILLPDASVAEGETVEWTFSCYMGPKEFERLHQIGGGLERIMRMDLFFFWHPRWMAWLSRQILRALIGLNKFFDHRWGYGFAITIITFVVKMLFWPLTHRSTKSMRKMQKIQPLIKEVREKYKDQPEKLNRKIMELYKEHKVNPVGGCLPIFLQIPVFFALFNTLRGAIELRQASFLWVADLSQPDTVAHLFRLPVRPLAILMGASMFGQQKLMPSAGDPSQARMMTFMSVFFMFIFYSMPAGLTLYWTVNQVLTIVQNLVSRAMEDKDAA